MSLSLLPLARLLRLRGWSARPAGKLPRLAFLLMAPWAGLPFDTFLSAVSADDAWGNRTAGPTPRVARSTMSRP